MKTKEKSDQIPSTERELVIQPPSFTTAVFRIRGTTPYVQNRFAEKAKAKMVESQEAGPRKRTRSFVAQEGKNFEACYQGALYVAAEGWHGFVASGLRNACVSACRLTGYPMTRAKLSIFVEADGFDPRDGTPLVRITKGGLKPFKTHVQIGQSKTDIRIRPMWAPGWEALVRIRFDADQFSLESVANLLMRVGLQVGIGEGRPDSKNSNGMDWGLFKILSKEAITK